MSGDRGLGRPAGRHSDTFTLTGAAVGVDFPDGDHGRLAASSQRTWNQKAVVVADEDNGRCTVMGKVAICGLAFDGDFTGTGSIQRADQIAHSRRVVTNRLTGGFTAIGVNDRQGVIATRPVDSTGEPVDGFRWQVFWADFMTASSLLVPVGRHPYAVPGHDCRFAH